MPERVVRSPGRVNLIGEHTDYNDGFVLPLAIDLELRLRFREREDGWVVLEYAGNRCGIMDQLAVAFGNADHALLIDCRSLDVRAVPLPADLAIVVCNSATPRELVESAYNERRAACEEAARLLGVPA